jgi:hypothetical protein
MILWFLIIALDLSKAVDVAAPAGNSICTDCSHLYPPKGKFCEPSADWQNLGAQSWWKHSNTKTTTIQYHSCESSQWQKLPHCTMHFQTGRFAYTQCFLLGIKLTMRDGLASISSLLNPFYYPNQPMHCFLFSNHYTMYAHIHDSLSNW